MVKFYMNQFFKVYSVLLVSLFMFLIPIHAQFSGGDGSALNPYLISTPTDLDNIHSKFDAGLFFKQTNDIDLTAYLASGGAGYAQWNTLGWMPIGSKNFPFFGNFDGNNFTIVGLTLNRSDDGVGLFGKTQVGAVLNNINVQLTIPIYGGNFVGGIVGINLGVITHCSVTGPVFGTQYFVGDLVGENSGNISECYATGDVLVTTTSGDGWCTGGLVGGNVITVIKSNGSYIYRYGSIINSYSTGNVLHTGPGGDVGGLVGWNDGGCVISNCFATGSVEGPGAVGGLVGTNYGRIDYCYATGKTSVAEFHGGFVGENAIPGHVGVITNSFWDKTTTGQLSSSGSLDECGKTTPELKIQSTFLGWDFSSPIWNILSTTNNGYPHLVWQDPISPIVADASGIDLNEFTANWNTSADATVYFIDVATDIDFVNYVDGYHNLAVGNYTNLTINGLLAETGYYYRVRAANNKGTSVNSSIIKVTTKASQLIIFEEFQGKTYGDDPIVILASGGNSGNPVFFTSSDNNIAKCTGINGSTVSFIKTGSVTIFANQAGNNDFAAAPQVSRNLSINKAVLTITADPQERVYATENPVFTGIISGTVNGESLATAFSGDAVYTCDAVINSKADVNIPIVPSLGTLTSINYTFVFVNSFLKITKAPLVVNNAKVLDKYYDSSTFATIEGATLSGALLSDDVSLMNATSGTFVSPNADAGINVITDMTLSGTAASNYTISQPSVTGNILPLKLTVSGAFAQDKVYDGSPAAIVTKGTLVGVVGNEDVELTITAVGEFDSADAGQDKPIDISMGITGVDAFNYILIQPTSFKATVLPKQLVVTAEDKTITYGDEIPILTLNYAGFVESESSSSFLETPTATCSFSQFADAGIYDIIPVGGSTKNYTFKYVKGLLTEDKAILSVTASDVSRSVGEVNPAFTLLFSGFKGADDASVIDVLPSVSCSADLSSIVDKYPVSLIGGSDNNYELALHDGTLTVTIATNISNDVMAGINLFPNPTVDYLFIQGLTENTTIRVYDVHGILLIQKIAIDETEKVDIIDLPAGIYLVRLSEKGISKVLRVVKN